ncbi:DUF3667 domain-containing protein [Aquimarina hainanensis]|uniref:DUF3667 domain-containing protein n=1 Tax=Aquimarina hainanensis TaxID=1578017 RepID=A0ABW5N7S1_9FLAO
MKETGRFLKKYRGTECLNCGVPLDIIDKYCHHCGQVNTTKKLALSDFFSEYFSSLFSYDSRLSHTIIALLFRPGKITKEYTEGKRVKYANPFRFYLSVSIIFFIINGFFIDFDSLRYQVNKEKKTNTTQTPLHVHFFSEADSTATQYYSEQQLGSMKYFERIKYRISTYSNFYTDTKEKSVIKALDSLNHNVNNFNKYIYKRIIKANELDSNPIELAEYIFNKSPFIIFFFLPFFSLILWLLYMRNPFSYMEHLVFTFHTQTMFFILLGLAILFTKAIDYQLPVTISTLLFLLYLYKSLRKFYNQGRFKTIVKFTLLNILFFILAGVGFSLAIGGSIFFY